MTCGETERSDPETNQAGWHSVLPRRRPPPSRNPPMMAFHLNDCSMSAFDFEAGLGIDWAS